MMFPWEWMNIYNKNIFCQHFVSLEQTLNNNHLTIHGYLLYNSQSMIYNVCTFLSAGTDTAKDEHLWVQRNDWKWNCQSNVDPKMEFKYPI